MGPVWYNIRKQNGGRKDMKLLYGEMIGHPLPTPSCHASSVLPLPDGTVLAAWFGGTQEGSGDVDIWLSRRAADIWSAPVTVCAREGYPHWNPVLYPLPDGRIRLVCKESTKISDWYSLGAVSCDGGLTWSEPLPLSPAEYDGSPEGGHGPVKDKPLYLSSGVLLAGCSTEHGVWVPMADRSTDGGFTWETSLIPMPEGVGAIQPTLWESVPGRVHALLRTDAGTVYRSDSEDGGVTWCQAYPTAMPNNNSGIDCTALPDGRVVLVCNPVGKNWGPRSPLCVYASEDNGITWERTLTLESGEGEFSYPAAVFSGGLLHVTYTWKRQNVRYCVIDPE